VGRREPPDREASNRATQWVTSSWDGRAVTPKPSFVASGANTERGSVRASALATVGRAPSNAAVTNAV
jgi:hypothetical protein